MFPYFSMLIFYEKDSFAKAVGQSIKTGGKIDYKPSKSDKAKANKAYKASSPDVQKKLDMIRKAKQNKPKPPAKPRPPASPKPKASEGWDFNEIPPLPGSTNRVAWTPGSVTGNIIK